MTNVILFIVLVGLTVSGQFLLKKGMTEIGEVEFSLKNLFWLALQVVQNIYIVTGLVLFGLGFLLWLMLLSRARLSIFYPMATGFNFVLIALASWLFLKEAISVPQLFGMGLIIAGVFLLFHLSSL